MKQHLRHTFIYILFKSNSNKNNLDYASKSLSENLSKLNEIFHSENDIASIDINVSIKEEIKWFFINFHIIHRSIFKFDLKALTNYFNDYNIDCKLIKLYKEYKANSCFQNFINKCNLRKLYCMETNGKQIENKWETN